MQLCRYLCSVCIGLFLISFIGGCAKKDGRSAPVVWLGSSDATSAKSSARSKSKIKASESVSQTSQVRKTSDAGVTVALDKPIDAVGRGAPDSKWLWPTKGEVVGSFATGTKVNKGLDLAARAGEPVHATSEGKVVYSGRGLKGYGELIILKHDNEFLSAYAHNQKLLVKEGDVVRSGQVIALAGDTDAHRVMLHFEIRKGGKPVDPLDYLPAQR